MHLHSPGWLQVEQQQKSPDMEPLRVLTASKKGTELPLQNLALPFPAILSASSGGVAENGD